MQKFLILISIVDTHQSLDGCVKATVIWIYWPVFCDTDNYRGIFPY